MKKNRFLPETLCISMSTHKEIKHPTISEEYIFNYDEYDGRALMRSTGRELIRCHRCKQWLPENDDFEWRGLCTKWKQESKSNDFCSYGIK